MSRNGEKVPGTLGKIVLQKGDILVLDCAPVRFQSCLILTQVHEQSFDEQSEEVVKNLTNITKSAAKSEREFMVAMQVEPHGPVKSSTRRSLCFFLCIVGEQVY